MGEPHTIVMPVDEERKLSSECAPLVQASSAYLSIRDDQHQREAGLFVQRIRDKIEVVKALFDEPVNTAHKLHKMLTTRRKALMDPLENAKAIVTQAVRCYEREAREKAERAAREAAERAREAAERARQAQVEALKAQGEQEAAKAVEAAEVQVNVPEAPKREAVVGVVMRTTWKFEVVDEYKLPRKWLCPDLKAIGAFVRETKGQEHIPGVRIYPE